MYSIQLGEAEQGERAGLRRRKEEGSSYNLTCSHIGSNETKTKEMAAECSVYQDEDLDDNHNTILPAKSGLLTQEKITTNHTTPSGPSNSRESSFFAGTSDSLSLDLDVNFKGADGAENLSECELASNRGLEYGIKSDNGCSANSFTPISPEQWDPPCASRFQTLEENGDVLNSFRPEAHPYLEWDELFALTDYVQLGYYKRGDPLSSNVNIPLSSVNGKFTVSTNRRGENGPDGDDNSSSSDLFDVFVNPVHCSASDDTESDDLFSSNDSESVVSETDSDASTSRPRKSSLRNPKRPRTPPGTPSKKSVRFADALGLDLETVRHILEMDPCPSPPMPTLSLDGACPRNAKSVLRLCFEQPGGRPDFLARLYTQHICLENVVASDMTIIGTIKVRNLAFKKEVRVRYSWDCWSSHANVLAMYVAGSCDGPTDRFSFAFSVPRSHTGLGDKVFFAVFYQVGDQEYWDNNQGLNYLLLVEEEINGR